MSQRWKKYLWLPGVILISAFFWIYRDTLISMWHTWGDSETYAHGYVVFPIVAFLIWRKRKELGATEIKPSLLMALLLIPLGAMWLISSLLSVNVIEQVLFIATIQALMLAVYGFRFCKVILFPLLFLYFAVPMGEFLVPVLMSFTADFTVAALKLTGFPVYRDGMFFSIPAGDFEVATACSGIRYLMASFMLGTLYAYLSYRSFKKQLIFALFSIVVPIFANAMRAYGIVIIAHLSKMKYAVGVDHLIYGWLFFGLVMFLLFYVGGRYRAEEDYDLIEDFEKSESAAPFSSAATVAAVSFLLLLIPIMLFGQSQKSTGMVFENPMVPSATAGWEIDPREQRIFNPTFTGYQAQTSVIYSRDDQIVNVRAYRYRPFVENEEMINETNRLVDSFRWRIAYKAIIQPEGQNLPAGVNEVHVRSGGERYLVWYWYQLNQKSTASILQAKLLEGWSWLTGGLNLNEAIVLVSVPGTDSDSQKQMQDFVSTYYSEISRCVFAQDTTDNCVAGD